VAANVSACGNAERGTRKGSPRFAPTLGPLRPGPAVLTERTASADSSIGVGSGKTVKAQDGVVHLGGARVARPERIGLAESELGVLLLEVAEESRRVVGAFLHGCWVPFAARGRQQVTAVDVD
jgi:hypothetical protein